MKSRKLVITILSFFILVSFACAEQSLSLDILAELNNNAPPITLRLQTHPQATSGIDGYDFLRRTHPSFPSGGYNLLYTWVGEEVLIDSWNAVLDSHREIELRFSSFGGASSIGNLVLSWNSSNLKDPLGRYFFTLYDYGADSSLHDVVSTVNMRTTSSYAVNNAFPIRYFKIFTNYSYCGDSIKSEWESCEGSDFGGLSCASEGLSGNVTCDPFCQVDYSGCDAFCGDGLITSKQPYFEECDFISGNPTFGGKTCRTAGFLDGSLACKVPSSPNECKIDYSGCISSDGSFGPPAGGSGGGGGSSCTNKCVVGQRKCVDGESYQICGDFNNDGCSEWSEPDKCLGVNPFCSNGFCFGCLKDRDCKEGFCINGRCETDCGKSCFDLGLQCGQRVVCGKLLNCGSCEDGFCNKGICSSLPPNSAKISKKDCSPDFVCSPWSECKVSFDSRELLMGKGWFNGFKDRLCFDKNKCYSTIKEQEPCLLSVEIASRENTICGIKYVEIYDKKTNKLLARTRDSRYSLGRAIEIFLLPGEITCEEETSYFDVSLIEKILFRLDIRRVFTLFK